MSDPDTPQLPVAPCLAPGPGEDLCRLSGDWRIFQLLRGHRWSLDDLVTAWVAASSLPDPRRVLDLGTGIGSVLLLLAWRFAPARCVGLEAQEVSVGLARRSILYNLGPDQDRCSVAIGDLRDPGALGGADPFDLISATPPYLSVGAAVESAKPQCGPCRIEHRGGLEDYVAAAERWLAPGGRFVTCAAARQASRLRDAAAAAGLDVLSWLEVVGREGKQPLLAVFTLARGGCWWPDAPSRLIVRDIRGQWTDAFLGVRRAMGLDAPGR
ncbi:MAG: SAM-dependent methyltransferase [Deltaproteobacteria bacterium]|nr:SAM-dependent methyltransferase [Deltaproteobacteria bacterium]